MVIDRTENGSYPIQLGPGGANSISIDSYEHPGLVERTFRSTMHGFLSNQTIYGEGRGAWEKLPSHLQFTQPFVRDVKVPSLRLLPHDGNLLTWVHLYAGAGIVEMHADVTMTVNNSFHAPLVLVFALGKVYAGPKQDLFLGYMNTSLPDGGWHIPAMSEVQSPRLQSEVVLQECVHNPATCIGALITVAKNKEPCRVEMEIEMYANGLYHTKVNATEINVPLSMHGLSLRRQLMELGGRFE